MHWYKHLYIGKKAEKVREGIISGIEQKKLQLEVFVIIRPESGHNLFEIYPSPILLLPPYREQEFLVIGIAVTYWEALEVVRRIVEDLYQKTGTFDVEKFLKEDEV